MDQDDTVKLTELPTGQDSSAGDANALHSSSAAPQMALVLQYFPFFFYLPGFGSVPNLKFAW